MGRIEFKILWRYAKIISLRNYYLRKEVHVLISQSVDGRGMIALCLRFCFGEKEERLGPISGRGTVEGGAGLGYADTVWFGKWSRIIYMLTSASRGKILTSCN